MQVTCTLSCQTKDYLARFYEILDAMICGMTGVELTGSISHNFIVQMIPHHRAAIEMSENALPHLVSCPLRRIASGIIAAQTKGIADMEAALPCCAAQCSSQRDAALYQRRMDLILQTMFTEMGAAPETDQIGVNFMREMIPHHEGAVRMAENALKYGVCPELVPILEAIITTQRRGIREMRALLGQRCC